MKQRQHHGFGVVEMIIIVAAAGLVAALIWLYVSRTDTQTTETQTTNQSASTDLTPESVIKTVTEHFAASHTMLDVEDNNQPKGDQLSIDTTENSPAYRVDGYDYYTTYEGGMSLNIITPWDTEEDLPTAADSEVRQEIDSILHELALDSTETISDIDNAALTNVYVGRGLVCDVTATAAASSATWLSCGELSKYPAAAEALKPLSRAIDYTDNSTVLSGTPKDSETDGYRIASISVGDIHGGGGAAALLWKQGAGNWSLFRYTQSAIECSAFNTPDLRAAFAGMDCMEDSGDLVKVTKDQ